MTRAATRPSFTIRGWHVAAAVTAFFAAVAAVDGAFMVMAIRTFPGQVSVTPYEDGLIYNRRIAQLEAQEKLGWQAAAEAMPGAVAVEFRDAQGSPVRGLAMKGRLERPATEAGRVTLAFAETAPGRYVAKGGILTGAWDLTVDAVTPDGRPFTAERRLTWR